MLGAEGERLTVSLAPVIERSLVTLEDGLGDLPRLRESPLVHQATKYPRQASRFSTVQLE